MAISNILIIQPSIYNKRQVNDQDQKKKKKEEKEEKEKKKKKKIYYNFIYILQFKRFIICYNYTYNFRILENLLYLIIFRKFYNILEF